MPCGRGEFSVTSHLLVRKEADVRLPAHLVCWVSAHHCL